MGGSRTPDLVAALLARIERLEQEGQALQEEVRGLREGQRPSLPSNGTNGDGPVTRRRLLGMAGAAAAAGLGGAMAATVPAGATTGNMQFGMANDAGSADTSLTSTTSNVALTVNDFTVDATAFSGVAGNGTGVKGTANNGAGVFGNSPTVGAGVRARTLDGYSLQIDAPGGTGVHALMSPGGGNSGPPSSGSHTVGEIWMDSTAILFQCTVTGIPGTWVQMPQLGRSQDVVPTTTTHLSGSIGGGDPVLWATNNSSSGSGVTGQAPGGIGVVGDTDSGIAVRGGVNFATTGVHLELFPTTQVGPPTLGTHGLGQFYVDQNGALFQCVVGGMPGTWVRQSPLVPLASPVRIYYSLTAGDGPLPDGTERSVAVTNGTTIPHKVSAVLTNLAVTPAPTSGFLAMFKDGTTWPGTSNVNFPAGQFASNNATSAVKPGATPTNPSTVKIRIGGATAHFVIDVFGYYP